MTPAERTAAGKPPRVLKTRRAVIWRCRVGAVRRKLGLSMRDVERQTGVPTSTQCHVERGCEVTLGHAVALARFYGMPVEVLWKWKVRK